MFSEIRRQAVIHIGTEEHRGGGDKKIRYIIIQYQLHCVSSAQVLLEAS